MSELGARMRTARQVWAAPGSRHDRLITVARILLPGAIGVLAAFLVTAPLTAGGDVSFVLDKNKVEVAKERMRLQSALYRGQDTKGQPFQLFLCSVVIAGVVQIILGYVRAGGLANYLPSSVIEGMLAALAESCKIEKPATMEGKQMTALLAPLPAAKAKG